MLVEAATVGTVVTGTPVEVRDAEGRQFWIMEAMVLAPAELPRPE